jgi:hypothetical protein
MDQRRLMLGGALICVVFGLILLCFTHGGIFNPVIPYTHPMYGPLKYHPERAYRDLTKDGPLIGLLILGIGAGLGVYAWAQVWPRAAPLQDETHGL